MAGLFATCLLVVPAFGEHTEGVRGQFSHSDYEFATKATVGGGMEATLGKMASEKAVLPSVKQFGEQMVTDHTKAGDRLKQIVNTAGATVAEHPSDKEQKEIDRLRDLSGRDFDREYVAFMIKDHEKDLKEFQKAAKKADNASLRTFAEETAPVIEQHLARAKLLKDELKTESNK